VKLARPCCNTSSSRRSSGTPLGCRLAVQDLHAALARLPREQREALLLVGAEGLSYEEAAEQLATKVGTIKSRVNRARTRLAELMGLARDDGIAGTHGAPTLG
jgi:RNA polymerase sigma-70 factor (ECF subfamily)